jgi:hypothetical protein
MLSALRLTRLAPLPERFHRWAFRYTLCTLFGSNVTVRALGMPLWKAKPPSKRIRIRWRRSVRPVLYQAYKRAYLAIRHGRKRSIRQVRRVYHVGQKRAAAFIRRRARHVQVTFTWSQKRAVRWGRILNKRSRKTPRRVVQGVLGLAKTSARRLRAAASLLAGR